MKLTNSTTLPAAIEATEVLPSHPRIGFVTAKGTFRFDSDGTVTREADDPIPLFAEDEETPLGLLPRDNLARHGKDFEVILLGHAFSPDSQPTSRSRVRLRVGDRSHELLISGDREWIAKKGLFGSKRISDPTPFEMMPLSWDRAFGGSAEVLIDEDSPVTIPSGKNPLGRGFDVGSLAEQLGKELQAPKGYPIWDECRLIPNVESPAHPITSWDDEPEPAGWATIPLDSPMQGFRLSEAEISELVNDSPSYLPDSMMLRAHPNWVMPLPPPETWVELEGLTPERRASFTIPPLRVFADYVLGDVHGTGELRPMMLVLLPDEWRFYIVYRYLFSYPFEPTAERSLRLRTEEGWFEEEAQQLVDVDPAPPK